MSMMDFIILKVNGEDLSSATHQQILQVLKSASDPIIVEVARKSATSSKVTSPPSSHYNMTDLSLNIQCSSSDMVNPYASTVISQANYHSHSPQPLPRLDHFGPNEPTVSLSTSSNLQTKYPQSVNYVQNCGDPLKINEIMEEDDDDDEEQVEIIKELVILRKVHPREIFGLTLSYSALAANDHSESEVYISAIESESVASKQTGIKIGDQILQINGIDVHSKAQVVALFQSCGLEVCMLLGRPTIIPKKNSLNNKGSIFNCDLPPVEEAEYSSVYDDVESSKGKNKLQTNLDKDSGIGRGTDETTKTEESSECDSSQTSFRQSSQFSSLDSTQSRVDLQQISLLMQHLAIEYHQLQRLLQGPSECPSPRIQALPPPTFISSTSRVVPRMGTKLDNPQLKIPNTVISAGNSNNSVVSSTGADSTRSSPITMEFGSTINSGSLLSLKLDKNSNCRPTNYGDDNYNSSPTVRTKINSYTSSDQKSASSSSTNDLLSPHMLMSTLMNSNVTQDNECHYYDVYDPSTVNHAINPFDQEVLNNKSSYKIYSEHEYVNASLIKSNRNDYRMEWVVKKRPDGTRYITRRPIRNKMLKDRSKKLFEEKSGLTTEEEESSSDIRMNKYISKTDKRKTQDKSKEKKYKMKESPSLQLSDPSTSCPVLPRDDLLSLNRLTLRDMENRCIEHQKLYNKPSFIVGTTMF